MSKISISSLNKISNATAAAHVSRIAGCALSTSIKRLSEGKVGFFYNTELFLNDYLDRAEEILDILSSFDKLDLELYILEIPSGDNWADVKIEDSDQFQISSAELRRVIENTKGDFQ